MEYSITQHDGFDQIVASGAADYDTMVAMITELISRPEWRPGSAILLDYRAFDAGPLKVGEISRLAELVSEHRSRIGPARLLFVVSRNLEFGLVRMWEAYVSGNWDGDAMIFKSREEALVSLKDSGG